MSSYDSKSIDIFETQKQIIQDILNQKRRDGIIKSDAELQQELAVLMAKLMPSEPMLTIREQLGMTDSDIHNETFEEISYDLNTIFSQVNQIDGVITKHQRLNQSLLNNIQLRIRKTQDSLTKYERLADEHSSQQMHLETFLDGDSFENDTNYYIQNGIAIPNSYWAKLDLQREAIKLPAISSQNALIGAGGVRLGVVKIGKQLGSDLIRISNPDNGIDKSIDTSQETFWSESILVDSPIEVSMGSSYYNIDHGAAVELEVYFDYLTQVNEISINIFGEYPLDIMGIHYFTSDNQDEIPSPLIYNGNPITAMQDRIIKTSTSYQFEDIFAKRMHIVLRQRHYIKSDFIASAKNQREMDLWFNGRAVDDPSTIAFDGLNDKPVYQNKVENSNPWWYYRNMLEKLNVVGVNSLIDLMNADEPNMITKYEYNYGIYNLDLRKNEYQNVGYYVSKPIPANNSIRALTLEVQEDHPTSSSMRQFTDIEYAIYDGRNWHPIVPENAAKIGYELLSFTSTSTGTTSQPLRFPVKSGLQVFVNGVLTTVYTAVVASGYTHIDINASSFDVTAIYTASYIPTDASRAIDFLEYYRKVDNTIDTVATLEQYSGTDRQGYVTLNHFPYVDKQKLNQMVASWNPTYLSQEGSPTGYLPLKVQLINPSGYHIEQSTYSTDVGTHVENVTDYFDSTASHLKTYNEAGGVYYQYRVEGNQLHFNTVIPEGTQIIVEYPYLIGDIRVRATLRRNTHAFFGFTPVLNEYIVHMQTFI